MILLEKFVHDGVEYQLPSKNGLVFHSGPALYRLAVRSERPIYDSGVEIGKEKELVLEFGEAGSVFKLTDEHGDPLDDGRDHFEIRGHYADTLIQGQQKGWSDEERALVEKKALATQAADGHQLHTQPPAAKPWPSYDETPAGKVAEVALLSGLIGEALAYERENKSRPTVIGDLKKAADSAEPTVEELAAV